MIIFHGKLLKPVTNEDSPAEQRLVSWRVWGGVNDGPTWQEVVLGVQQGADGLHPGHLHAGGRGLQREAFRWSTRPQDELTGVAVHAVLHGQVAHLSTHTHPAEQHYSVSDPGFWSPQEGGTRLTLMLFLNW